MLLLLFFVIYLLSKFAKVKLSYSDDCFSRRVVQHYYNENMASMYTTHTHIHKYITYTHLLVSPASPFSTLALFHKIALLSLAIAVLLLTWLLCRRSASVLSRVFYFRSYCYYLLIIKSFCHWHSNRCLSAFICCCCWLGFVALFLRDGRVSLSLSYFFLCSPT